MTSTTSNLKKLWDICVLSADQKRELEDFLVEYHEVFAKHRFDVGYNTELEIKLTPEHQLPVYVQGTPAPVHLRDKILVQFALLQNLISEKPCYNPNKAVRFLFIVSHLANFEFLFTGKE